MTQETQTHREEIDRMINIYLDGITSISQDAGWRGDSMMAKIIEFGGQIPKGTGNDISNLSMINAIRMLRDLTPEFRKIQAVVLMLRSEPGTEGRINALLSRNYYRGLNEQTGKSFTNIDRMNLIGAEVGDVETADNRFRYDIRCAYRLVLRELERYERYAGIAH